MRLGVSIESISRLAGGLGEAVRPLCLQLQRNGLAHPEILSFNDKYTKEDRENWNGLKVATYDRHFPRPIGRSPELMNRLTSDAFDLLHVHGLWQYSNCAIRRRSQNRGTPYVVSPHGMLDPWAVMNSGWKKRFASRMYEMQNLRKATCLHALCESEAKSIRQYGLTNPICVVPNGVEIPGVVPEYKSRKQQVLFLGRLHPKKGLDALVAAWKSLSSVERGEWSLVVAGWGDKSYETQLKRMCGNSAKVRFVGPKFGKEKVRLFQESAAFILPSFSEGLPMAVLEAWSHGLPVLKTQNCNLPDGFRNEAAISIEPTARSIADGLRLVFTAKADELEDIGARGLALVCQKYTWQKVAQQMSDVYAWCLGEEQLPDCVAAK